MFQSEAAIDPLLRARLNTAFPKEVLCSPLIIRRAKGEGGGREGWLAPARYLYLNTFKSENSLLSFANITQAAD